MPIAPSAAAASSSTRSGRPWTRASVASWLITGTPSAESADIELEAVAARVRERRGERRERVLRRAPEIAAVRQSER